MSSDHKCNDNPKFLEAKKKLKQRILTHPKNTHIRRNHFENVASGRSGPSEPNYISCDLNIFK